MKNPGVEFVKNSGEYRLVKELKFSDILSFVMENIVRKNVYTFFYLFVNLVFLALLLWQIINGIRLTGFTFTSFKMYFPNLMWGTICGSFIIIPFHEGLHALAFLLIGAKKIKFGADLNQMLFYATAVNFVGGRKGFTLVALTPFLAINFFTLPLFMNSNLEIRLFITAALLFHNIMCIGDFGMLSFFRLHKEKEMVTFDDVETKTAFFYERIKKDK